MNITCKLCNQELALRSFAMHLRWSHNSMKNEDYIKQFGEFRPKFIKQEDIKQESTTKCEICNEKMMHNQQLMYHITKKHPEISKQDYIIKYIYNGVAPLCKCGCGNPVKIIPHGKENKFHLDYIKGHWDWVKPGYNTHSDKTKEQMRVSAIKRIELNKQNNIVEPWHSKSALVKRNRDNIEKIQQRIKTKHNVACLNLDESLSKKKQKLFNFKCLTCEYEWSQVSFYPRCHKCNPPSYFGVSLEEQNLVDFISPFDSDIILNSRNTINPYELDIYFHKLALAIEYNGLYWHSEKMGKYKDYHLDKWNKCREKNIHLVQIFSDEWLNKTEIVKSRLLNLIGKSPNKIYARKCEVREVEVKEKNRFLNNNHIQGEDKSAIKLGLYYNNELVSLMTFGKPRKAIGKKNSNTINEWELVRFCNKINTNVVGGASKLFKCFIKTNHPKHIYSFADNRWSSPLNNLYIKLGFTLTNISNPGYWYTKSFTERYHRYNFSKQKLIKQGADKNLTEFEIMDSLGYSRVWDCGTSRYEISF